MSFSSVFLADIPATIMAIKDLMCSRIQKGRRDDNHAIPVSYREGDIIAMRAQRSTKQRSEVFREALSVFQNLRRPLRVMGHEKKDEGRCKNV